MSGSLRPHESQQAKWSLNSRQIAFALRSPQTLSTNALPSPAPTQESKNRNTWRNRTLLGAADPDHTADATSYLSACGPHSLLKPFGPHPSSKPFGMSALFIVSRGNNLAPWLSFSKLSPEVRRHGHTRAHPPFLARQRENTLIHFPKEILSLIYHFNLLLPFSWLLNHIYWGAILNFHSLKLLLTSNLPPLFLPNLPLAPYTHTHTHTHTHLSLCLPRTFHRMRLLNYKIFNIDIWKSFKLKGREN